MGSSVRPIFTPWLEALNSRVQPDNTRVRSAIPNLPQRAVKSLSAVQAATARPDNPVGGFYYDLINGTGIFDPMHTTAGLAAQASGLQGTTAMLDHAAQRARGGMYGSAAGETAAAVLPWLPPAKIAGTLGAIALRTGRIGEDAARASKIAYHGSPVEGLTSISANPATHQYDNASSVFGAFASPSEAGARRYGGNVYPVSVNLNNPAEMSTAEFYRRFQSPEIGPNGERLPSHMWAQRANDLKAEAAAYKQSLMDKGFDGLIIRNKRGGVEEIASFNDIPVADKTPSVVDIPTRAEFERTGWFHGTDDAHAAMLLADGHMGRAQAGRTMSGPYTTLDPKIAARFPNLGGHQPPGKVLLLAPRDAGSPLSDPGVRAETATTPEQSHRLSSAGEPESMRVLGAISRDQVGDPHRALVEQILQGGGSVPPEVLKDYPDLTKFDRRRAGRVSGGVEDQMHTAKRAYQNAMDAFHDLVKPLDLAPGDVKPLRASIASGQISPEQFARSLSSLGNAAPSQAEDAVMVARRLATAHNAFSKLLQHPDFAKYFAPKLAVAGSAGLAGGMAMARRQQRQGLFQ